MSESESLSLNESVQSVVIFSMGRKGNIVPGDIGWRKHPFYFSLSSDFLHSTNSYYPETGIHLAGYLCKFNTTSVFPRRPTWPRLLLCSGTSSRLGAGRTISNLTFQRGTWPQVAGGTRAFWESNHSRGKWIWSTVDLWGLYSLRKWREMNKY